MPDTALPSVADINPQANPAQPIPSEIKVVVQMTPADSPPTLVDKMGAITEFGKVFIWPSVFLLVVILFWRPIAAALRTLPDIAKRAQEISFREITVKLAADVATRAEVSTEVSAEVKQALAALPAGTIRYFMIYGERRQFMYYNNQPNISSTTIDELAAAGLIRIRNRSQGIPREHAEIELTELGVRVHSELTKQLGELIIERSAPAG